MVAGARSLALATGLGETAPTLEALIAKVALGDERAFAALYDQLAGRILGMVTRVLRSRVQAEEVTQEVLLEIWRKAAQFSAQRGTVVSWVLTIAHRRAVDRVRSEQSSSDRELRAERLDERRPFDEVAESTMATVDRELVRAAMAGLTGLQRECVVLAYYEGLTYREVAEALDTPLGTIKTRIRDGLIRLRDCLGER